MSRRAYTPATPPVPLPAYTLSGEIQVVMRQRKYEAGMDGVRGHDERAVAVKDNEVYLIEVNRVRRTVPLRSPKATGVRTLASGGARDGRQKSLTERVTKVSAVLLGEEIVVLPFNKFPGVDPLLRRSKTPPRVMGVGRTFARKRSLKAQLGGNSTMKKQGRALLSVRGRQKSAWWISPPSC